MILMPVTSPVTPLNFNMPGRSQDTVQTCPSLFNLVFTHDDSDVCKMESDKPLGKSNH